MDMFDGVGRRSAEKTGRFLNIGQHSLNGYERDVLFRNNGDGTFTDVAFVNAADRIEDGRGLSIADLDRDGELDLVLRNYHQPAQVLRNQGGPNHWLQLVLVGSRSNRDAVGARVRVSAGGRWQTREVHAGSAYLSQQSLVQHFGLGGARQADALEVTWPSGAQTTLGALPGDRRWRVVEGDVAATPVGR
jgi:enediyne biosynthesis protein E4